MLHLQDGEASLSVNARLIEAKTGWCDAKIPAEIADDELSRLADGLYRLTDDGYGSYLWTNEGGEIQIEIVMAKRGETHWSVRLQSPPDFLHELRLVFVGRQDDLIQLIGRLRDRAL